MRCKARSSDPYQGEPARPLSPLSHCRILSDSPYLCPGNTRRPGTCLFADTGARAGATSDSHYSRQLKETPGVSPPAAARLWPPPARLGLEQVCQHGRGWPHHAASLQLVHSQWPAVNLWQQSGGGYGCWSGGWRGITRWALLRGIKHSLSSLWFDDMRLKQVRAGPRMLPSCFLSGPVGLVLLLMRFITA